MRSLRVLFVTVMLLLVTACGSTSASSSSSASKSAAPTGPTSTINVELTDFMIQPTTVNAKAGAVTFHASNTGKTPHNFYVKASDTGSPLGGTKDLNPGQNGDSTITLQPGTYIGFCAEPGHESLGMKISIVVS